MKAVVLLPLALLLLVWSPAPVHAQTFTLLVHVTGGNVSVAGGAEGTCTVIRQVCTFLVDAGATVRLSATGPLPGRFSAGTGPAAACALSTCSFTMTGAADVTATFASGNGPVATLTVALAGDAPGTVMLDGVRCQNASAGVSSTCTNTYLAGSTVTLAAAPAPGARFAGYSAGTAGAGGCTTPAVCQFAIAGNASVTASFRAMTALAISPASATRPVGAQQVFTASATYSDGAIEAVGQGAGAWSVAAQLPTTREDLAAVALGGTIYAIGGGTGLVPTSTVDAFDPATGTWSARAPLPAPRSGLSAVAMEGFVYALGGDNVVSPEAVGRVERYDPVANSWIAVAPLPTPRTSLAAGVVNGIVYAVGGFVRETGTVVATVDAYDPATNTWTPRAPMPTARQLLAVGVIDGTLYAVGGLNDTGPLATVEAYDPATDSWTTRASMPAHVSSMAAAVSDGVLYVMGGSVALNVTYAYDPRENAWAEKGRMPTGRRSLAAAATDGVVYAIGGNSALDFSSAGRSRAVETFVSNLRWTSSVPAVAGIDAHGRASALGTGTTTIAVSSGAVSCAPSCASLTVFASVPTEVTLDSPANGSSTGRPFVVAGWALNRAAPAGTGVDAVHVYAFPAEGAPIFLAVAAYGSARPDVGAVFGEQFTNSGFAATAGASLAPGTYTIVAFAHTIGTGTFDAAAVATVTVTGPVSTPFIAVDTPADNQVVTSAFEVAGWAIDAGAPSGTGVDAVQFFVQPAGAPAPGVFVGAGTYGIARDDVGAALGARFTNSGFHFTITGLGPGSYTLGVYARSTVTGSFTIVKTIPFTIDGDQLMSIDLPSPEATVTAESFAVAGWAIDRAVESTAQGGTGVDALHVYAYRNPGSGEAPTFLGVATLGFARSDVADLYGARFTNSGYSLDVNRAAAGLAPGVYAIVVHAHSTATGSFNNLAVVRVVLQ